MSPVRLFILVIAALAAIVLAFVVRGAFAPKKAEAPAVVASAPAAKPTVQVLVAKRDLPIGTRLTTDDIGWQSWPAEGLNPTFITDGTAPAVQKEGAAGAVDTATKAASNLFSGAGLEGMIGTIVKEPFVTGEPIVARKVVRSGEGGFMTVVLTPGMRAIAAPVTVDTAVAGFILPGDRVDLIYSRDSETEDVEGYITKVVLKNVRVLAIDQKPDPEKDAKTMVGAVATLEVPAADIELAASAVAQAKANGALILVLRSISDTAGGPTRGNGIPGAAQSGGSTGTVRVHRAGQVTEVKVGQ
ncbi:Flp pilus assembly protein CpaB [Caulobacter sp. SLTY]|uniref:Flp pilus assembly protein CpaB n=1 Tax=Caulobacter sp. SLTY TaxID=2683262 RepID=UPI001412FDF7|nr:Flp pilus assembly protein CpaB [Caulobacter sp. SLTY]NBB16562.1 Flp pilus assembly protein CpaB [Caulobacter sp. SLTY]